MCLLDSGVIYVELFYVSNKIKDMELVTHPVMLELDWGSRPIQHFVRSRAGQF